MNPEVLFSTGLRVALGFVCLAAPVFFFQGWKASVQLPGARFGDQPHYLIQATSLAKDGDLHVANNYARPGLGQGRYLAHVRLDHHTRLVHKRTGQNLAWHEVYRMEPNPATPHQPHIVLRRAHADFKAADYHEVAFHPPGYPALLAALAWPLIRNDVEWYEAYLLALQLLLLAYACARVGRSFSAPFSLGLLGIMALAVWNHAASFFTEGVSAAVLLLAIAAFRERRVYATSLWLGILLFLKESHGPVCVLFWLGWLVRGWLADTANRSATRDRISAVLQMTWQLAFFPVLAFGLFLARSWWLYGTLLQTYVPWEGNPDVIGAIAALWFSAQGGLISFEPAIAVMLAGLLYALRSGARPDDRVMSAMLLAIFAHQFALIAAWSQPFGGLSYAGRLLVPATTALLPGLFWLRTAWQEHRPPLFRHTGLRLVLACAGAVLLGASLTNSFWAATHLKNAAFVPPCVNLVQPGKRHCLR